MTNPTSYLSIRTRFYGPTNTKGARIVACSPDSMFNPPERLTMAYDYELGDTGSHHAAAELLLPKVNQHAFARLNPKGLRFDGDMFWTWSCD